MSGEHRVPDSVSACQSIEDRQEFKQCLCRHLELSCDGGSTAAPSLVAPPTSQPDWSRSYSISAGLCILFLAMCAVIIVLRVLKPRYRLPAAARTSVSAAAEPPPYEVVVRSPPSYSVLQPPAYQRSFVEKIPAALLAQACPAAATAPGTLSVYSSQDSVRRSLSVADSVGSASAAAGDVRFTLGDESPTCDAAAPQATRCPGGADAAVVGARSGRHGDGDAVRAEGTGSDA